MTKDHDLDTAINNSNNPFETLHFDFPDGEVVTIFYDDLLHAYYRKEGNQNVLVPGTTTITGVVDKSQPLMWWAVGQYSKKVISKLKEQSSDDFGAAVEQFYQARLDKVEKDRPDDMVSVFFAPWTIADLMYDGRMAHHNYKLEASEVGHEAHNHLEFLAGITENFAHVDPNIDLPEVIQPKAQQAIRSALAWLQRHNVQPIFTERKVYSRKYDYSGTMDSLCVFTRCGDHSCCPEHLQSGLIILDFKTSNALHDTMRLQLAAYHQAIEEELPEYHEQIVAHVLLQISKDEQKFSTMVITPDQFAADLDGFLGALQLYNWMKNLEFIKRGDKPKRRRAVKNSVGKVNVPMSQLSKGSGPLEIKII